VYETFLEFRPVSTGEWWFLAVTGVLAVAGFLFLPRVYPRGPVVAFVAALLVSWVPVQMIAYVAEGRRMWLPGQHSAIFFWGDSVLLPSMAAAFALMRRTWVAQQDMALAAGGEPDRPAARPLADRWLWRVAWVGVALAVAYVFHAGELSTWPLVQLHEPAKVWHDYLVYPLFVYFLGSQLPFLWQVRWRAARWSQPVLAGVVVLAFTGWVVLGHVYDPAHRIDQRPLLVFALDR
jgi:hypothetical protein